MCAWPPYKSHQKIRNLVQSCHIPDPSWQICKVRIMYETNSYQKARLKAKEAENTSDLQSNLEAEMGHKRFKKRHFPEERVHHSLEEDNILEYPSPAPSTSGIREYSAIPTSPLLEERRNQSDQYSLPQMHFTNPRHDPSLLTCQTPQLKLETRSDIFQRKVLTMLEKLTQEVRDLKKMSSNWSAAPVELSPGRQSLPLKQIEDLNDFEEFLKGEGNYRQICAFLSMTGGYTIQDCTRKILQKLLSNDLSKKYNWKGSRGLKLPFSTLIGTNKLIVDVVRSHKDFALASDV